MNKILIIFFLSILCFSVSSQEKTTVFTFPSDEQQFIALIKQAGSEQTFAELESLVETGKRNFIGSKLVSNSFSSWLRENHPIYNGKLSFEIAQFRAYLFYSLKKFIPTNELYKAVKAELQYANHPVLLASAASAASIFDNRSEESIPLLINLLGNAGNDEVDISDPMINYPLQNPTRLKYEIIKTLAKFGNQARSALTLIEEIKELEEKQTEYKDSFLIELLLNAVDEISNLPSCCKKDISVTQHDNPATEKYSLIPVSKRKEFLDQKIDLLDQESQTVKASSLKGKPYFFTFFYTRCTNMNKCPATVARLAELQQLLDSIGYADAIGVYALTYDSDFDQPSILRNYGHFYGIRFSKTARFFCLRGHEGKEIMNKLNAKVSYGISGVNLHSVQAFLIDKKGKLAMTIENEVWRADEIAPFLISLTGTK